MRRMLLFLLPIVCAASLPACRPDLMIRVRGELTAPDGNWFLTPCDSSDVYWVRVLASNPHFALYQRVEKLNQQNQDAPIVAEFLGALRKPTSLDARSAAREIDAVLSVSEIVSVDMGSCATLDQVGGS